MKSSTVLTLLVPILSGSWVLSFQTTAPLSSPSSLRRPAATFVYPSVERTSSSSSRRQPLLASTIVAVESADVAGPATIAANPWERVCTTVESTTAHLNQLRQKVAKSGVATAISYSFVSNVFTSVAVSLAWYGFNMQTGLSPISPGQWKPFLAWYGGFYAVNSLLKPLRFMLALGIVPHAERVIAALQSRFGDSKRAAVAGSTTLLLVISGTIMSSGIGMASLLSGTPIFPPTV